MAAPSDMTGPHGRAASWWDGWASRSDGCARCGQRTRMWRRYCAECKPFVDQILGQYTSAARQILATHGPLGQEWIDLHNWLYGTHIPRQDALDTITADAMMWIHQYIAFARSDGIITDDELATFRRAVRLLGLDSAAVVPLEAQLVREQVLGRIRSGDLPTVSAPDLHLPLDEYCYLVAPATRWRDLKSGPQPTPGRLAITNRKIRFIAHQHGGEVPLSKVQRARWLDAGTILLEATTRSLSGRFSIPDSEYTTLVIDAALRIDRRILLPGQGGNGSRTIPQHVKSAVWQRDRGQCCECGATSNLEFDHIIPFSRGGASTEGNLQLLCRGCNLAKSNRI